MIFFLIKKDKIFVSKLGKIESNEKSVLMYLERNGEAERGAQRDVKPDEKPAAMQPDRRGKRK